MLEEDEFDIRKDAKRLVAWMRSQRYLKKGYFWELVDLNPNGAVAARKGHGPLDKITRLRNVLRAYKEALDTVKIPNEAREKDSEKLPSSTKKRARTAAANGSHR